MQPARRRRFGAIVDIENTVIRGGHLLPRAIGLPLIEAVRTRAEGIPTRVASGRNVLVEYMPVLAGVGWSFTAVPAVKDAADIALVEAGYDFVDRGVTDLLVVSGDHAFVELAGSARLHVVAHADHLGRRLRLAATTVTCLPALRFDCRPATTAA